MAASYFHCVFVPSVEFLRREPCYIGLLDAILALLCFAFFFLLITSLQKCATIFVHQGALLMLALVPSISVDIIDCMFMAS